MIHFEEKGRQLVDKLMLKSSHREMVEIVRRALEDAYYTGWKAGVDSMSGESD